MDHADYMIDNYHAYPLGLRNNHARDTIIYVNMSATAFNPKSAFSEVKCLVVKAGIHISMLHLQMSDTNAENKTKLFKLLETISDHNAP